MKSKKKNVKEKQKQPYLEKRDINIDFVCDDCCLPLNLYGENIILTVENDKFITHILCDLHAEEFLNEM